jgi:spore coat polysaccharide biosynthesis predicted glycosyltransferase SpsG
MPQFTIAINNTDYINKHTELFSQKKQQLCAGQKQYKQFETHTAAKELMLPADKAITSTGELSETNQQNVVI